ncbi:hypothetical protein GCM10027046_14780 [Uliginosibacterium flavum]
MKAKGVCQVFDAPSNPPAPLIRGAYVGAGRFAPLLTRGWESDSAKHGLAAPERDGCATPVFLREEFDSLVESLK